jgi:hypothetical protein
VTTALAPEFSRAKLKRVLAEQRKQGDRDHAGAKRGHVRNRQFQRLRQEHRDTVATHQTVGFQHIGEAARHLGDLVERGARSTAVLVA